ncbi:retrovirus-related pol polyprotein from transposon TNT 1-94 [Tanacetum coccineum]|uniref:Retrovirus-related pol polyprotein from transposon TNT 1-94 n=1 Tax=Tanacetum coccineum TaxID=301880 RepID=A0ABQ5D519_9ASTR
MNSTVCQPNASVLNTKTINSVNDGLNIICVSCGKDVFLLSHEKCVARYALSRDYRVKRALFTTSMVAKSKNLRATFVVSKSRLSVAKTTTATNKVIQLVLWIVDSGCLKHMTGNLSPLINFIEKFIGRVRFMNDYFAAFIGYGDYVKGNLTNGDDFLIDLRDSNLYTISISELAASSPVCLTSIATSTKSWLWHQRLSHLNFGTINQLTSKDLVDGLPKLKYNKDQLCSACEQGKRKKASLPPKLFLSTESKLKLIHMDSCGPMSVFDELIAMAFECNNSKPRFNCMNFQESSEDSQSVSSKTDLDNLFGSLYEEYYATSPRKVSYNSAANTLVNEVTSSSSSIVIE